MLHLFNVIFFFFAGTYIKVYARQSPVSISELATYVSTYYNFAKSSEIKN